MPGGVFGKGDAHVQYDQTTFLLGAWHRFSASYELSLPRRKFQVNLD